jgi:hypothetical protein
VNVTAKERKESKEERNKEGENKRSKETEVKLCCNRPWRPIG